MTRRTEKITQSVTIKIINEAESYYHQSLNNKQNTWGIFWFDGEFGCAIGGFKTSHEAQKFWEEYEDSKKSIGCSFSLEVMKCSICEAEIKDKYGHNAEPLKNGRCCSNCNSELVIPARLETIAFGIFSEVK